MGSRNKQNDDSCDVYASQEAICRRAIHRQAGVGRLAVRGVCVPASLNEDGGRSVRRCMDQSVGRRMPRVRGRTIWLRVKLRSLNEKCLFNFVRLTLTTTNQPNDERVFFM